MIGGTSVEYQKFEKAQFGKYNTEGSWQAKTNRTYDFDSISGVNFSFGDPLTSARSKFTRVIEYEKKRILTAMFRAY